MVCPKRQWKGFKGVFFNKTKNICGKQNDNKKYCYFAFRKKKVRLCPGRSRNGMAKHVWSNTCLSERARKYESHADRIALEGGEKKCCTRITVLAPTRAPRSLK